MAKPQSDKELIEALSHFLRKSPSDVAKTAGLAVSTLTRPLNQPVKHRLSMPTLDKLKAAYPTFPAFAEQGSQILKTTVSPSPDQLPTLSASTGETTSIVALDLSLSMGPGTAIEDFVESEPVEFDIGLLRSITRSPYHRLRIVRGIGTSMEPKFYTGDRILVDTTERTLSRFDGYYWITLFGSHGLKRLRPVGRQRVLIVSENPDHEPMEVDASDLTIEGRAIWFARDL